LLIKKRWNDLKPHQLDGLSPVKRSKKEHRNPLDRFMGERTQCTSGLYVDDENELIDNSAGRPESVMSEFISNPFIKMDHS
jgi:hypothetical protein